MTLVVLNLDQVDLETSESIKHREPDQLPRLARLAGRVIENAFGSVTIVDVLMKFSLSFRANGSDQEK